MAGGSAFGGGGNMGRGHGGGMAGANGSSSGPSGSGPSGSSGGRGPGDAVHGYGNDNGNQSNNAPSEGPKSLSATLGVDQQGPSPTVEQRTQQAVDDANGKSGTFSTPLSQFEGGKIGEFSLKEQGDAAKKSGFYGDKVLSSRLSDLGMDYTGRKGIVGWADAAFTNPTLAEIGDAVESGVGLLNPALGLVLRAGDVVSDAMNYGLDGVKNSLPGVLGSLARKAAGPLVGAVTSIGTNLAMGNNEAAGETGGGVVGSMVNGLVGGNALTGLALNKAGQYTGGLLSQSVANAAPSSHSEGGNYSTGEQAAGNGGNHAEGSLSLALFGNTGNVGNVGRTGMERVTMIAPPPRLT
ncbi:MAG: hypothetical protein NT086_12440 [Proteobacteria bacterium]|nr:hypothetical protein [Pseudomonadota bacterium]